MYKMFYVIRDNVTKADIMSTQTETGLAQALTVCKDLGLDVEVVRTNVKTLLDPTET